MIVVRHATGADAPEIAVIQAAAFDAPWSSNDLRALLEATPSISFLAHEDDTPLGFILGRVVADEAEILSLAVRSDLRRRGIGRKLLDVWTRHIAAAGARSAFLEVSAENVAAITLYRTSGYRVTGRRKDYYHRRDGSLGDALMMMVNLPVRPLS